MALLPRLVCGHGIGPVMWRVKLPLEVSNPSTTMTTCCPDAKNTGSADCGLFSVSSLQAISVPVQVASRTERTVSNADPSVSILYTPALVGVKRNVASGALAPPASSAHGAPPTTWGPFV